MNVTEKKTRRRFGMITIGMAMFLMAMTAAGGWAATFQTVDGEVVIEAENYSRLGGTTGGTWYTNDAYSGYRGDGYLQSTSDDPGTLEFSSDIIRAEYDIDFKETGTYYLHLRTYATDHANNGYFATMDGVSFDYGHENAYYITTYWMNQWWWYNDGGGAGSRGYMVSVDITATGIQTLAIYRRDRGTRIDRIWLTKNQDEPQNTGTLSLTDPSVFELYEGPVSAPTFNPDGGTYTDSTVSVVVSCATEGATIRYTTNGDDPSETSPTVTSGGELVVEVPGTLKAKAWLGISASEITTASYTRQEITSYAVDMTFAGSGIGELSDGSTGVVCDGDLNAACSVSYTADSEVILTATATSGSIFKAWGGDCAGTSGNVCTLLMDGDKTVEANFILQGQANAVNGTSVVSLTSEERDLYMNIADGERQFPDDSPISTVVFQGNTATIDYRDGTSETVSVTDGDNYTDDFINLVLLSDDSTEESFASLLALPSFEAQVTSAGDIVQVYYPSIVPNSGSSVILVGDLDLLKLKPVGQSAIFFSYRENAADAVADGDYWLTEHLQDTILLPGQTLDSGTVVDLHLAVEDNGRYDLDEADQTIVDPFVMGTLQADSDNSSTLDNSDDATDSEPTTSSDDAADTGSGGGGGGCFIGTLMDWRL